MATLLLFMIFETFEANTTGARGTPHVDMHAEEHADVVCCDVTDADGVGGSERVLDGEGHVVVSG
jgi:hypothetical protein